MTKIIEARFSHGVFQPLEKINMPESKEVITIPDEPKKKYFSDAFIAAGSWKDTVDYEKLIKDIYANRSISTRNKPSL